MCLLCVLIHANCIQYQCVACEDYQFQCSDGQCISALLTCNGVIDCKDESDELHANCSEQHLCLAYLSAGFEKFLLLVEGRHGDGTWKSPSGIQDKAAVSPPEAEA